MVNQAEITVTQALKQRENEQVFYHYSRACLIASILTDNGQPVRPPSVLRPLDDVGKERWNVCVEIEKVMSET